MSKSIWQCHQACSRSNDGPSTCSEAMHMHTLKHTHITPPLLHHIIKPISRLNGEAINTSQGSRWARRVYRRLVTLVLMVPRARAAPPVTVELTVRSEPPVVLIIAVSTLRLSHSLSLRVSNVSEDNRAKVNPSWYCYICSRVGETTLRLTSRWDVGRLEPGVFLDSSGCVWTEHAQSARWLECRFMFSLSPRPNPSLQPVYHARKRVAKTN